MTAGEKGQFLSSGPGDIQPCRFTQGYKSPNRSSSSVDPAFRVIPFIVIPLGQYLKFQFVIPFANAIVERGGLVHLKEQIKLNPLHGTFKHASEAFNL